MCVQTDSEAHFRRGAITQQWKDALGGRASVMAVLHSHNQQAEAKARKMVHYMNLVMREHCGHIDRQTKKQIVKLIFSFGYCVLC